MVRRGQRAGTRTGSLRQTTTEPGNCGGGLLHLLDPVADEGQMFSLDYLCRGRRFCHPGDRRNLRLGIPPVSGLQAQGV